MKKHTPGYSNLMPGMLCILRFETSRYDDGKMVDDVIETIVVIKKRVISAGVDYGFEVHGWHNLVHRHRLHPLLQEDV